MDSSNCSRREKAERRFQPEANSTMAEMATTTVDLEDVGMLVEAAHGVNLGMMRASMVISYGGLVIK